MTHVCIKGIPQVDFETTLGSQSLDGLDKVCRRQKSQAGAKEGEMIIYKDTQFVSELKASVSWCKKVQLKCIYNVLTDRYNAALPLTVGSANSANLNSQDGPE